MRGQSLIISRLCCVSVHINGKFVPYHFGNSIKTAKNMTIEETLQIALDAHKGQKDLDGKPAILHPIAVGLMGGNDAEIKAGFLHDVVEDSDLTIDDLRSKGVDEEVLAALELLTHDKSMDYFEYVYRIAHSGNYTAIHTKINDLKHNFDRGRKSYKRAKELNDMEKAERLKDINEKPRKALQIFGHIPLYNSLESIDF